MQCKRCQSEQVVKNGKMEGKQRYHCKSCGLNFVEGDQRVKESLLPKKALAVLLYSLSKASFRFLGKLFGTSHTQPYRWIQEAAETTQEPEISGDIREMEFDEMWHFIGSKKTNSGSSKPWIVAHGELWPGCSAVVMLQLSDASMKKSNT